MNIFFFQLLIALSIVIPFHAISFLRMPDKLIFLIVGGWAGFTLKNVYTPKLMFLQFATIGVSYLVGELTVRAMRD